MKQLINFLFLLIPVLLTSQSVLEKNLYDFQPGKQRITNLNGGLSLWADPSGRLSDGDLYAGFNNFFNHGKFQGNLNVNFTSKLGSPSFEFDGRYYVVDRHFFYLGAQSSGGNFTSNRNLTAGIGMGRLDLVNEFSTAERLVDKLGPYLNRSVSGDELIHLAHFVRSLKNERFLANRGSFMGQLEELFQELKRIGVLKEAINEVDVVNDLKSIYQFEPLINRFNGNRFTLSFSSRRNITGYQYQFFAEARTLRFKYEIDKYISSKKQWNNSFDIAYTHNEEGLAEILVDPDEYETTSVTWNSEFHYLSKADTRFSAIFNLGYKRFSDPINSAQTNGIQIGLNLEYEKRIKRNLGATIGVGGNYSSNTGFDFSSYLKLTF